MADVKAIHARKKINKIKMLFATKTGQEYMPVFASGSRTNTMTWRGALVAESIPAKRKKRKKRETRTKKGVRAALSGVNRGSASFLNVLHLTIALSVPFLLVRVFLNVFLVVALAFGDKDGETKVTKVLPRKLPEMMSLFVYAEVHF